MTKPDVSPSVVTLETGPVTCQRCHRPFANLAIYEIAGIRQLRLGNLLIANIKAVCQCGWVFLWHEYRDKELVEFNKTYQELLKELVEFNKTYQELLKQISTYKAE